MDFELTPAQQDLVERVDRLATEKFASRAEQYDRAYAPPIEDIQDLHREGLLLANLPKEHGGLGFGVDGDDPLSYVLAIEHLARVNPSTAHCFQVHNHVVQMVGMLGDDRQRARWLGPTIERGALFSGVGSEPPGSVQTLAKRVAGGYQLNGTKYYATNASIGEWITVTAATPEQTKPGPGMRLMVNSTAPGVRVDASTWQPMGMKACVSPMVFIENYFVPTEDVVAETGDPRDCDWLGKFHVAFASNYLGTAQGLYDWAVQYLRKRGTPDSFRRQRAGELKATLDATRLLVYRAASEFRNDLHKGMLLGCEAKWLSKSTLNTVMRVAPELVGSSALFETYPFERLYRDGQLHMLHNRIDVVANTIGSAELGADYNVNAER